MLYSPFAWTTSAWRIPRLVNFKSNNWFRLYRIIILIRFVKLKINSLHSKKNFPNPFAAWAGFELRIFLGSKRAQTDAVPRRCRLFGNLSLGAFGFRMSDSFRWNALLGSPPNVRQSPAVDWKLKMKTKITKIVRSFNWKSLSLVIEFNLSMLRRN